MPKSLVTFTRDGLARFTSRPDTRPVVGIGGKRFVDDSLIRQVVADRLKQLEERRTDPEKLARSIARLKRFEHPATFAVSVTVSLVVVCMVIVTLVRVFI